MTPYLLFLKYALFTMDDCDIAKTVSPTPRKLSTIERTVGSVMAAVSGLENVQRQAGVRHQEIRYSREPRGTLDSCKNSRDKDRICSVVN